jgi:hypothetical protein
MAMKLLATNSDSTDVASITFNSGIDSTYNLYIFKFIDIDAVETGDNLFQFACNATDTADYNDVPFNTTFFYSELSESDSGAQVVYYTPQDNAEGIGYQTLAQNICNAADESCVGTLWLFNPSNTTYVTQFYARMQFNINWSESIFIAGWMNDTTAIDDINFKISSGNMNGTIKMYGVG